MIYILIGEFVSSCSSYNLYSHLGNLYHLAHHVIYIPIRRICIILLVVWFIFPLGEFVSSCSSYNLYSRLRNLYHFARCMIYIPAWGICIILLIVWFIFPLREFVSFVAGKIPWCYVILDLLEAMLISALSSTRTCQNLVKQEF